jgi:glucosamine--fructose-6-phosphate aminotransferase (isomerizing)
MCGIIGYLGDKEASPILIEGLKKLEYRGYDSAGLCILNEGNLNLIKKKGRVSEIEILGNFKSIKGKSGIAHTRWATHGEPNEINSHPHTDCRNELAIAHNGIIENHFELKKILEKEGHKFISETDSEVLAHLIEKFYDGDLEKAVSKTLNLVEGTFGLIVMHKNKEEIIGVRRGSPLIIGLGEKEKFIASDSTPLIEHTKKVIYLEDNELVILNKSGYTLKTLDGEKIDREIFEIKWSIEQIKKQGFKHFMLKEIFEQPKSLENFLKGRIKNDLIKLTLDINLEKIKRIILIACGTSWHSALIGKYLIEKIAKIPVEVDYASEFRYRNPLLNEESDLVIAISQSGETADTLAALKESRSKNVKTLGIINVVGSTISREVDSGIYLHAGPEIGVASTKAFSSQVLALLVFSLFLKEEKGLFSNPLLKELSLLSSKIKEVLKKSEEIRKIAEEFKSSKNFLYLGRGINFPVALEGALKLKEISYIHAEGYPAAEMKHGPIALVDKDMPVVFLATNGTVFGKVLNNIEEVKSRGGKIITITDREDETINRLSDYVIKVPETMEEISPIINCVPLQLLAYHIADLKEFDVDRPRNLAKSVTVE